MGTVTPLFHSKQWRLAGGPVAINSLFPRWLRRLPRPVLAVAALRWNYRWRGVARWLRTSHARHGGRTGWQVIRSAPTEIIVEQAALAEGVTA